MMPGDSDVDARSAKRSSTQAPSEEKDALRAILRLEPRVTNGTRENAARSLSSAKSYQSKNMFVSFI